MIVIGVTGMPGSGKSVIAGRIGETLSWPVYSMGDVVRREVQRRGLPLTSHNIEAVARKLREEMGDDAVARLLMEELERDPPRTPGIVVDGMRSLAEARALRALGPLCIVAVHASPMSRFQRVIRRARRGDAASWDQFVERDLNNLALGIGSLIALADYMIVNEQSVDQALREAQRIARMIRDGEGKSCCGGRY